MRIGGIKPRAVIALAVVLSLVAACNGDTSETSDAEPPQSTGSMSTDASSTDTRESSNTSVNERTSDDSDSSQQADPQIPGVTATTIRIGLNADLAGATATTVSPMIDAQKAYWAAVNEGGGIDGRQVELVIRNNAYDVPTHMANYAELVGDGPESVIMFSHSSGSPHTAEAERSAITDEIVVVPSTRYSGWADTDTGANIAELGASLCVEGLNGLSLLADVEDATRVAVLSSPGEDGQDSAAGARLAAASLGLELVYDADGLVVRGSDLTQIIADVVAAQPDVVWAAVDPLTLSQLLAGTFQLGLIARWSGSAESWNDHLLDTEVAPIAAELFRPSSTGALWGTVEEPGMQALIEGMQSFDPTAPLSDSHVAGWLQASAAHQILEQAAASGDLSRSGIVDALSTTEIDFGGLAPNQSWSGAPDEYLVRETYLYEIILDQRTPNETVADGGANGYQLLDGPSVSDSAASFTFEGACWESGF